MKESLGVEVYFGVSRIPIPYIQTSLCKSSIVDEVSHNTPNALNYVHSGNLSQISFVTHNNIEVLKQQVTPRITSYLVVVLGLSPNDLPTPSLIYRRDFVRVLFKSLKPETIPLST